jgi:hypothetical protein
MNSSLYFFAQNAAAEFLFDELIDLIEKEKEAAPRNRSKFAPAQFLLKKLENQKYADAIRVLSSSFGDDPVESLKERLLAVKNPNSQGKGIKKKVHSRRRSGGVK